MLVKYTGKELYMRLSTISEAAWQRAADTYNHCEGTDGEERTREKFSGFEAFFLLAEYYDN